MFRGPLPPSQKHATRLQSNCKPQTVSIHAAFIAQYQEPLPLDLRLEMLYLPLANQQLSVCNLVIQTCQELRNVPFFTPYF